MIVKKLNHPLLVNGQYIYPPTSASLVKLSDGRNGDEAFVTVGQVASETTPVKPAYPLQESSTPIYPKTTVDQVISRDGITPLSEDGIFQDDVLTLEEIEASTDLSGYVASASSVESMVESLTTTGVSVTTATSSDFSLFDGVVCRRCGNVVTLQVGVKVVTPADTHPGTLVLSGLPYPSAEVHYHATQWIGTTITMVRVTIQTNGNLYVRGGTSGANYGIYLTYLTT